MLVRSQIIELSGQSIYYPLTYTTLDNFCAWDKIDRELYQELELSFLIGPRSFL